MNLLALAAFSNHDIWMLHDGRDALVVGPGDAPVARAIDVRGLKLAAILVTHHHPDCGDTLFSGGCGRRFEGTPAQMHESPGTPAALRARKNNDR